MRSVRGSAGLWPMLLILLTLFGVTPTEAQQSSEGRSIEERIARIQKLRLVGRLDRSYRLPGQTFPGDRKNGVAAAGGTISGTITGIDDIPAIQPYMLAYPADDTTGGGAMYAEINANGSYTVSDLAPGQYYLVLSADGYRTQYWERANDVDSAKRIVVTANGSVTGINFAMMRQWPGSGSITGTVRSEATGRGIAGAQVLFSPDDGSFGFSRVTTDNNGNYRITGLAADSYILEVWAENYGNEYYGGVYDRSLATPVAVADSAVTSGIDFSLNQGGMILGRVLDGDGNPIEGAAVEAVMLSGDDSTYRWSMDGFDISDENGYYSMGGLAEGTYEIYAMAETDWFTLLEYYDNVSTRDSATPVSVALDDSTSGIDFSLESQPTNGEISGTVVDKNGEPVPGAIVAIESFDENDPFGYGIWVSTETNALGQYSFTELPDGEFFVSVTAQVGPQYVEQWYPNAEYRDDATPVTLSGGVSDPLSVDFRLSIEIGTSGIGGTVRYSDGNPVMDAAIELIAIDPTTGEDIYSFYSYTDQNGRYAFPGLLPGKYLLHTNYWADGASDEKWYRGASTREGATVITLANDDIRTGVDFELSLESSTGTLTGRVTDDSTGAPVERAYVEIMPVAYGTYMTNFIFNTVTDDRGEYSLTGIPAGEYLVSVFSNSGYETFENTSNLWEGTPVTIAKDSTSTVDFGVSAVNDGPGVISGQVTADNGTSIPLAIVVAMEVEGEKIYPAITGANGSYEISGLPAGDYIVYGFAPDHIGEYYNDAFDWYDADPVKVATTGATTGIDFSLFADAARNLPENGGSGTPQATGTVGGVVRSTTGEPIVGATVYILDDNGNPVSSARTGSDGRYEIDNVPAGAGYRLRATGMGYEARYNDNSATFDEATRLVVVQGRRTVDFTLQPRVSGIRNGEQKSTRSTMSLSAAQPNPFTSETTIGFTLAGERQVRVEVRDLQGRQVVELFDGRLSGGRQSIRWDARDTRGNLVPAGVYLYTVTDGTSTKSGQVILVR